MSRSCAGSGGEIPEADSFVTFSLRYLHQIGTIIEHLRGHGHLRVIPAKIRHARAGAWLGAAGIDQTLVRW